MLASETVQRHLEDAAPMPYLFDNDYTRDVYQYAKEQTRQQVKTYHKCSEKIRHWSRRKQRETQPRRRVAQLGDPRANQHFPSNVVRSAKYTWYNAIPKFLYEQMGRLANLYFLLTGVLFLIDEVSPTKAGSRFGQIISLSGVLFITAVKEAYEDFWRHREDIRLNRAEAVVLGKKGRCRWGELRVGDIVRVDDKEALPADVVLLSTSAEDGIVYIETRQLDGESNMKVKLAAAQLMDLFSNEEAAVKVRGSIECDPPNDRLYEFRGCVTIDGEQEDPLERALLKKTDEELVDVEDGVGHGATGKGEESVVVPISFDQFLPRGCRLRNTDWIHGLVINTGKDTKIGQNLKKKPKKRSTLDKKLDKLLLLDVFLQLLTCALLTGLSAADCRNDNGGNWYLQEDSESCTHLKFLALFFTYVVLTASMVPLALYVSMEITRLMQSIMMVMDEKFRDVERQSTLTVRTSNLNEDCGMVSYLFSDKTGTLTSNEMVFKKYVIDGTIYSQTPIPEEGVDIGVDSLENLKSSLESMQAKLSPCESNNGATVEFFRLLSLCNSVVLEEGNYVGTSPDEVALVNSSKDVGFAFSGRTNKHITIDVFGVEQVWELLGVLEFNSSRKRMSVIVKSPFDGTIRIYCKGADFVIFSLLSKGQDEEVNRLKPVLDRFASTGLRTLCMCSREVSLEEFTAWYTEFTAAQTLTSGREEVLEEIASRIEHGMQLLGASAIEDRLQEEVPETLRALERAGVRTWILTGDKQETAINIGISCGLLDDVMNIVVINENSREDVEAQLDRAIGVWWALRETMNRDRNHFGLVLDGHTLQFILKTDLEKKLVVLGKMCKTVLACRVSPKQKTELVEAVRHHDKHKVTMAIGDGANDVGMIQAAHVGVGICGLEGVEAKLASDFSFTRFRFLQRLMLVHGRWNYKRMAKMSQYVLYKSIAISVFDIFFSFLNGLSGQLYVDPLMNGLYNILLTAVPIIAFSGYEQDLRAEYALDFPEVYRSGPKGAALSVVAFLKWTVTALFHGVIAFFIPLLAGFDDPLYNGRTIGLAGAGSVSYLIIVLVVNLTLAVYVSSWNLWTFLVWLFFTTFWLWGGPVYTSRAICYDAGMNPLWLDAYQEVYGSMNSWLIILLCVTVSILPVLMYKYVVRNYYPNAKVVVEELQRAGLKRSDVLPKESANKSTLPVLDRRGVEYPLRDVLTFDMDEYGGGLHDRFNPVIGIMNRHRRMKRTLSDSNLAQTVFTDKVEDRQNQTKHRRNITVGF